MLVTDAMPLVGTNEQQFMLHGRQITLHENRLTGPDGTLAGAHLTMIDAVRNAVALLEVSLVDALIMASRTPAVFLGLESELGLIAPGYRADLVAFNANFEVVDTWIGGSKFGGRGERDFAQRLDVQPSHHRAKIWRCLSCNTGKNSGGGE